MVFDGYKTYTAALLLVAEAVYEFVNNNNPVAAMNYFIAALGLFGLRSAIPVKVVEA